jgi:hypothetical protein
LEKALKIPVLQCPIDKQAYRLLGPPYRERLRKQAKEIKRIFSEKNSRVGQVNQKRRVNESKKVKRESVRPPSRSSDDVSLAPSTGSLDLEGPRQS